MSEPPQLQRNVWQKVPGWSVGEIFPIIIRPGIICSNSYLLDTARALIVIDPGTDPAQIELINRTLEERHGADDKPVLVILTHCHQDHSQCADQIRTPTRAPNLLLIEASGATALRAGNRERTLAMLYPENPPVCRRSADADLFGPDCNAPQILFVGPDGELCLSATRNADPSLPKHQSLSLGGDDQLLIYHAPGHTPCSICIQAGALLFVGDLPFAADPGLIGLDGWSQPDLLRSLDEVRQLIPVRGIALCCTGHGNPLPADALQLALCKLQEEASLLADVNALDNRRLAVLKEFAGELIDEAEYLFSVISGRLYAIAFHLENLEEAEEAARFTEALDLQKIDRVLDSFRAFHDEFNTAAQPTLTLVMKGVQTARALEQAFEAGKLQSLLDVSLLRRASRLLGDYVALVRGMRLAGTETTPDLEGLLAELVHGLDMRNLDADQFIASADDPAAYLKGLVTRLAFSPAFRDVRVNFVAQGQTVGVPMAPDRLGDMLMSLLESMTASGASTIQVACLSHPDHTQIRLSGAIAMAAITTRRIDISRRMLAPLGGHVQLVSAVDAGDSFVIDLPRLASQAPQTGEHTVTH